MNNVNIILDTDIGNAMGILQINSLKQSGEYSKEDEYWLKVSERGLKYSDYKFWSDVFIDN